MKKQWRKLGLLYSPSGLNRHPKLLSHAANPLPVHIHENIYRIFFSGRDEKNRSSVGAVDIDIVSRAIIQEHYLPFFEHGDAQSFFADGVSIGNCYSVDGVTYMLFMGWQNPTGAHWRGDIGRLIVGKDLTLSLASETPFMACDAMDTLSLSYPWVEKRNAGGFDMWYGSTSTWDAGNGEMLHVINHASSMDGHNWSRKGLAVPFALGVAQAFSRPCVIGDINHGYQMWFSYRNGQGQTYRIGTATSADAKTWALALDETGIDVSCDGWDSEMIEYPFVFDHKGQRYMLYNGNSYGKAGFGLAVLEQN